MSIYQHYTEQELLDEISETKTALAEARKARSMGIGDQQLTSQSIATLRAELNELSAALDRKRGIGGGPAFVVGQVAR